MDFLWHKVDENEKEKIKKEAKSIMDNFAKALEKVEKEKAEELVRRKEQTRKEAKPEKPDADFRRIFFDNAPQKEGDDIIAEKGKWK